MKMGLSADVSFASAKTLCQYRVTSLLVLEETLEHPAPTAPLADEMWDWINALMLKELSALAMAVVTEIASHMAK